MTAPNPTLNRAGLALIACSLAFVAVFSYLASAFDYPAILARGADQVLPRLAAGGSRLRTVWAIYAALPLGILVAGLASGTVLARGGRGLRGVGMGAAVAAAVAMMLGLARWPTIEWALARDWAVAADMRGQLAMIFDATNLYLGNVIGEFAGEMALALWFITLGIAMRRDGRRRVGTLGIGAGAVVAVAALRNITGVVAPIAAAANVVLPIWLVTLGVLFARDRGPSAPFSK